MNGEAAKIARPHIRPQTGPGKGGFPAITLEGVAEMASFWNCSPREAMITLLKAGVWPLRFARNRGVLSADDQVKLLSSRVAIVGCGGLGGHVATLLSRLGVGALTLCDHDVFDESNLNRQLLARESRLGQNKALVAEDEIRAVASHVETRTHPIFANPDTLPDILAGADIAVDCLDSLTTRRHLETAAHALGIPFIYGSVAGEEGFAMLTLPGGKGLRAVLGGAEGAADSGAERTLGVPALIPSATAALEAHLAFRALLGEASPEQTLYHLDLAAMRLVPIVI